jgi:hypothetical protein
MFMSVMIGDDGTPAAECMAQVVGVSFFLLTVALVFRLLILGILSLLMVVAMFVLQSCRDRAAASTRTSDDDQIYQLETQ